MSDDRARIPPQIFSCLWWKNNMELTDSTMLDFALRFDPSSTIVGNNWSLSLNLSQVWGCTSTPKDGVLRVPTALSLYQTT
ncbi:hypothetical protein KIF59_18055 [Enterobacter cloacae subsp. cloacae]|nr:hypothetical protein [Enterobacter cloacae subsp. cloacae]